MSPLAGLLLKVMRGGAIAAAVFVSAVIGIEGWTHWRHGEMSRADVGFMVVLVLMLAGALWLACAIARELRQPGP